MLLSLPIKLKGVMFSVPVCVSVCNQDNLKSYAWNFMKLALRDQISLASLILRYSVAHIPQPGP